MKPGLLLWCALLAAALALRAWGLGFGAPPIQVHPDEGHYAGVAARMSWDDLNPHYFENPPLLTELLFAARELHALGAGPEATRAWVAEGGLIRLARWCGVLFGVWTVLLVGAAARRLLGSPDARSTTGAALAAGAVVAFSFLHGRDSHYGVNDVPMVALVSLALYAAIRAREAGALRWLWVSAVAAGLATAMKYSGGIAIAVPLAVIATRPASLATRAREALLVLALFAATFLIACPWPLLATDEFVAGFRNQWSGWGDRRMVGQADRSLLALYGAGTLALLGWAHLLAAAAGVVLLVRRHPRSAVVLLAAPLLYLAVMLNKPLFYWRFALPLLPFLAVAASFAWDGAARRLSSASRLAAPVVLAALIVLASVQPAVALARHDWLASQPSTWLLARDWLLEHVPAGDDLFLEGLPPRLPTGRYRVWLADTAAPTGADGRPLAPMVNGGWVVTDSWFESSWRGTRAGTQAKPLGERLAAQFPLVAEFTPGPHGDPPFIVDAIYTPLSGLWDIERPGFTIRVYRVEPGEWERLLAR